MPPAATTGIPIELTKRGRIYDNNARASISSAERRALLPILRARYKLR